MFLCLLLFRSIHRQGKQVVVVVVVVVVVAVAVVVDVAVLEMDPYNIHLLSLLMSSCRQCHPTSSLSPFCVCVCVWMNFQHFGPCQVMNTHPHPHPHCPLPSILLQAHSRLYYSELNYTGPIVVVV